VEGELLLHLMRGLEWIADNVWLYRSAPLQLLTKGDNNAADDTELYARGQSFLDRKKDIVGSVLGYVPFVGYVTILLSEYPWLKTAMLGFMALTVVLQRE
jgi:signal peptidase